MQIDQCTVGNINNSVHRLLLRKMIFKMVGERTGVPWQVVGIINLNNETTCQDMQEFLERRRYMFPVSWDINGMLKFLEYQDSVSYRTRFNVNSPYLFGCTDHSTDKETVGAAVIIKTISNLGVQ